jgi:hypothetical protein
LGNKSLLSAVVGFMLLASAYIAIFLYVPEHYHDRLKDLTAVILAIPASLLAFCFQLRLSRISRLDAWVKDYQSLIRDIAEWQGQEKVDTFTREDCVKVSRFLAQAEGLSTSLKAIGLNLAQDEDSSVFALARDLDQLAGCPPNTPRSYELTKYFENAMYSHSRAAPSFMAKLYR